MHWRCESGLHSAIFQSIETLYGSTAPGASQTQATKRLPPAQESITSCDPSGTGQATSEERACRGGIIQEPRAHTKFEARHSAAVILPMPQRRRYLIVDGHSLIFAWPELRKLHQRRSSLAREALIKQLRHYQDWTGVSVVVVFDGKGSKVNTSSDPGDVQIVYSRRGQTADAIIERLASKYAERFDLRVATSDLREAETVHASGAEWLSPNSLHELLQQTRL